MFYIQLWIAVLTCTLKLAVSYSYCDCNPRADHPQNHYCRVDFAIKATILNKSEEFNEISTDKFSHHNDIRFKATKYTVLIHEIYKYESTHVPPTGVIDIWTVPFCPAFFPVTATHVIMGTIRQGYLETTYCDWNPIFVSLFDEQYSGFTKDYKENCKCKVQFCDYAPETGLCKYNKKKNCLIRWDFPFSFQGQCYISYCKRKKKKCIFKQNYSLKSCVEFQQSLVDSFNEKYGETDNTEGSGTEDDEGSGSGGGELIVTPEQKPSNSLDE